MPTGGFAAATGEIFAAGLRNEVGLTIDSKGRMWGVENGRDNLMVGGEDIHFDNPGEEVNLFDTSRPGRNYGYPFCWSEGIWMGAAAKGRGTQHLDPEQPGGFTEAKCQDANVVVPPAFTLGAHLAPLGIVEYKGGAYPSEMSGSLFVVSHGSWNREIGQVGRTIIRLKMGRTARSKRRTSSASRTARAGCSRAPGRCDRSRSSSTTRACWCSLTKGTGRSTRSATGRSATCSATARLPARADRDLGGDRVQGRLLFGDLDIVDNYVHLGHTQAGEALHAVDHFVRAASVILGIDWP